MIGLGSDCDEIVSSEDRRLAAFIVGREPAAARSLLVDTGASINLHGSGWMNLLEQEVLKPNGLSVTREASRLQVGGVSAGLEQAGALVTIPMAVRAFDNTQAAVILVVLFRSHEIKGGCPALWCYESMNQVDTKVWCRRALLEIEIHDQVLWVVCEATASGHLLMPIDR